MSISEICIRMCAQAAGWVSGLFLLAACAPQNVFVLMPDSHGNVGAITVSNEQGSQTLDQEGQGVFIAKKGSAPSSPKPVSEQQIDDWFGGALAAAPTPPRSFILFFNSGTSELTPESMAETPDILDTIQERNSNDISVVGHSDRKGSEELNWMLSLERARAVERILLESGVPAEMISTTSHGEGNPLIPTEDDVAEPENRRVEVTVR